MSADLAKILERAGVPLERIRHRNDAPVRDGRYVLYWMQAAQRAACNPALEVAIRYADASGVPAVAAFGLTDRYPGATLRHYAFLLDGLAETAAALADRGIPLVIRRGEPDAVVAELAADAALVVVDSAHTLAPRAWRDRAAVALPCRLVQVEGETVLPPDLVSDKEEYAARTIRPKIHKRLDAFLRPLREATPKRDGLGLRFDGLDPAGPEAILTDLDVDRTVPPVADFSAGTTAAEARLRRFLRTGLPVYDTANDDPLAAGVSGLSPYLHFGQIGVLRVALAARKAWATEAARAAFLEQLIVRRELAVNFVRRNRRYTEYGRAIPEWARATLARHASDPRPATYTEEELGAAATHDPCWNAAQTALVRTGRLHNRMRMYWGKKILEWTPQPEAAYALALRFNDRYALDGRDPNGYANVAWCFGKHDRPWKERPVFGAVRYMNEAGLRRKFDVDAWVARQMEGGS
ncbi:MAG: deoxyribodipyrimidine photo-lyase [Planctomycetota bacterium]